jgi:flagellar basal body-associated protein FliL
MPAQTTHSASSTDKNWLLEITIGIGFLVIGLVVWAYSLFASKDTHTRPVPAWLSVAKVVAQMGDGRMLKIKVNLQLARKEDEATLSPHGPAFKALVESVGGEMRTEEITGPQGITKLGTAILEELNGYLDEQRVPSHIQQVAFDEVLVMP